MKGNVKPFMYVYVSMGIYTLYLILWLFWPCSLLRKVTVCCRTQVFCSPGPVGRQMAAGDVWKDPALCSMNANDMFMREEGRGCRRRTGREITNEHGTFIKGLE